MTYTEQHSSFNYSEPEVACCIDLLRMAARQSISLTYNDVASQLNQRGFGLHEPHHKRLWDLLGIASERELIFNDLALSALVATQETGRPGNGSYELLEHDGRPVADRDKAWIEEVNRIYSYWATR